MEALNLLVGTNNYFSRPRRVLLHPLNNNQLQIVSFIKLKYVTMLSTNSLWFEIALVSIIYALGNTLFGHFEERTPKWRRVGKYVLTLIIVIAVSIYFGRTAAIVLLASF